MNCSKAIAIERPNLNVRWLMDRILESWHGQLFILVYTVQLTNMFFELPRKITHDDTTWRL